MVPHWKLKPRPLVLQGLSIKFVQGLSMAVNELYTLGQKNAVIDSAAIAGSSHCLLKKHLSGKRIESMPQLV